MGDLGVWRGRFIFGGGCCGRDGFGGRHYTVREKAGPGQGVPVRWVAELVLISTAHVTWWVRPRRRHCLSTRGLLAL